MSTEREVSGNHFDKHTESLFNKNTVLIRNLTHYVVQTIKSMKRESDDHFDKHTQSLFNQKVSLVEKLTGYNYVVHEKTKLTERSGS